MKNLLLSPVKVMKIRDNYDKGNQEKKQRTDTIAMI